MAEIQGTIVALMLLTEQPAPGRLVEHISCPSDPTQTYRHGCQPTIPRRSRKLRGQISLDSLVQAARGDSYEAASARRSLALVRVQLSSLVRDLQGKGDRRAEILQRILDSMK